MSKHTPGPWKWDRTDWKGEPSDHRIYISGDEHDACDEEIECDDEHAYKVSVAVAVVEGNETSPEVTKANGRLIAAAPDLLAACEMVAKTSDRRDFGLQVDSRNVQAAMAMVRAAIRKATEGGAA